MAIMTSVARTIFQSTNITSSSYIYTSDGLSGANDGWLSGKKDYNYVQVGLGTLTATGVILRVEGRSKDGSAVNRVASLDIETLTVTSIDKVITISEKFNELRVGAKLDGVATPNNLHVRFVQSEVR